MTTPPVNNNKPRIGITLGDINGIGPEVVIKALRDNRILDHFTPVVYGSAKTISFYRKMLDINDFNYQQAKVGDEVSEKKVTIINCWDDAATINVGQSTEDGGKYALISLQQAVADLKDQKIDALVTAPINKHNIQTDEFDFPGHTEYLTKAFETKESLMLLVNGNLRVGVVTGHVPLKEVVHKIDKNVIKRKVAVFMNSLKKDFGIGKPKLALLGINPHAGDNGLLGSEEDNILIPVINELKNEGHLVYGPYPADGFFGAGQYRSFDGVLAMYHDQGLVPFKALSFENGVNFTAGLPIVRTSPDHGTAYSIAGKNAASPQSMYEALYTAYDILKHRAG